MRTTTVELIHYLNSRAAMRRRAERKAAIMRFVFEEHPGATVFVTGGAVLILGNLIAHIVI